MTSWHTKCEVCDERAIMLLYAKNPGSPTGDIERGMNPMYPPSEADIAMNVCTECFWAMSATMREEHYVNIRATGVIPNKAPSVPPGAPDVR